ncbi:MAG: DUF4928 family protein [Rhodospirillales bacterium]|jgi:hypothetical protein|nr:DUF4928 family protein [Rhodospirillales bacterium]
MRERLREFAKTNRFRGKGPLCVALVVTDHAKNLGLPLDASRLLTDGGGQVLELGRAKVQGILARHGIERVLAEEGGRTSRGSIGKMRAYVEFLNALSADCKGLELNDVENFWIECVEDFFSGHPFSFRLDGSLGLRAAIRALMKQAEDRQREMPGTMFLGSMMQHLVGAKLALVLGEEDVEQHNSNENDEADNRLGDFEIGDVSIHVSSSPGEALIRKCRANLDAGKKPLIVTTKSEVAEGLADNASIGDRIDVIDFEQFLATNIYERGSFRSEKRQAKLEELFERYNLIVEKFETDPSLRIEFAKGR